MEPVDVEIYKYDFTMLIGIGFPSQFIKYLKQNWRENKQSFWPSNRKLMAFIFINNTGIFSYFGNIKNSVVIIFLVLRYELGIVMLVTFVGRLCMVSLPI